MTSLRDDPRFAQVTLLTARQVGELLSVSERQVWRMAASGELPEPIRLGKQSVRWRLADLMSNLEAPSRKWSGAGETVQRMREARNGTK